MFDGAFVVIPFILQDARFLTLLTYNTTLISSCLYGLTLAKYNNLVGVDLGSPKIHLIIFPCEILVLSIFFILNFDHASLVYIKTGMIITSHIFNNIWGFIAPTLHRSLNHLFSLIMNGTFFSISSRCLSKFPISSTHIPKFFAA